MLKKIQYLSLLVLAQTALSASTDPSYFSCLDAKERREARAAMAQGSLTGNERFLKSLNNKQRAQAMGGSAAANPATVTASGSAALDENALGDGFLELYNGFRHISYNSPMDLVNEFRKLQDKAISILYVRSNGNPGARGLLQLLESTRERAESQRKSEALAIEERRELEQQHAAANNVNSVKRDEFTRQYNKFYDKAKAVGENSVFALEPIFNASKGAGSLDYVGNLYNDWLVRFTEALQAKGLMEDANQLQKSLLECIDSRKPMISIQEQLRDLDSTQSENNRRLRQLADELSANRSEFFERALQDLFASVDPDEELLTTVDGAKVTARGAVGWLTGLVKKAEERQRKPRARGGSEVPEEGEED